MTTQFFESSNRRIHTQIHNEQIIPHDQMTLQFNKDVETVVFKMSSGITKQHLIHDHLKWFSIVLCWPLPVLQKAYNRSIYMQLEREIERASIVQYSI